MVEGTLQLLSSNETAGVGHVGDEPSTFGIGDLAEGVVFPVTRVSRGTADDETGLEELGKLCDVFVVDELGLGVEAVGKGLEVDRRRRNLLLGSLFFQISGE